MYPEEISAKILEKMKQCAEAKAERRIKNAIVTVPAYFNDSQKQATKDACKMAGLNCKRIINEPTAAAIAYGIDKASDDEKLCVVFDFGGGTLDISVLKIHRLKITVLAVNGNTHLGGQDIDNILMNHCLEHIQEEHDADLSNDSRAKALIRNACKEAKHYLANPSTQMSQITVDSLP